MAGTDAKYYDYGIPMTKDFEGYRDTVYRDTKGKRTIGYGFNIDDKAMAAMLPPDVVAGRRPLAQQEADQIFMARYNQAARDAVNYVGADTLLKLDPEKQAIIVDMAYNMGSNKLAEFKQLRKALQAGDNMRAAVEMKNSDWYKQVGRRSKHHVLKFMQKG
jgi:lysozyme